MIACDVKPMTAAEGQAPVVVVGGGLAGLAAATFLARAGRSVVLFEQSHQLGGRAITNARGDFRFNLGPHALYRAGQGVAVLRELGVEFSGGILPSTGHYAIYRGAIHALPDGLRSLLTSRLLGLPGKLAAIRMFASLAALDPQPLQRLTLQEWLDREVRHPDAQRLFSLLVRLESYADDPARQSAGAAIAQVQMASKGSVYYLDGGWQTLVDGLRRAAQASGVKIMTGAKVAAVDHDGSVRAVRLADGAIQPASAVIVAADPHEASALVADDDTLRAWAEAAIPVRAACLDVALRRLPQPRHRFALGLDRPVYFSVHSAYARLAPEGAAVIHVAKYLGATPSRPRSDEAELEALLDRLQPGWRDELIDRRFLPNMTVSNALVAAAQGGMIGRPGPEVPHIRNLYVAGDWVGPSGMLSDASLTSARQAAALILKKAVDEPDRTIQSAPAAIVLDLVSYAG